VKLLVTAGKTIQKAAAVVAKAVRTAPATTSSRDPWYRDDERKAEVNEPERWLARRPGGWLR
jgi:hypothetical protein